MHDRVNEKLIEAFDEIRGELCPSKAMPEPEPDDPAPPPGCVTPSMIAARFRQTLAHLGDASKVNVLVKWSEDRPPHAIISFHRVSDGSLIKTIDELARVIGALTPMAIDVVEMKIGEG